jgi:hypothetical protein
MKIGRSKREARARRARRRRPGSAAVPHQLGVHRRAQQELAHGAYGVDAVRQADLPIEALDRLVGRVAQCPERAKTGGRRAVPRPDRPPLPGEGDQRAAQRRLVGGLLGDLAEAVEDDVGAQALQLPRAHHRREVPSLGLELHLGTGAVRHQAGLEPASVAVAGEGAAAPGDELPELRGAHGVGH